MSSAEHVARADRRYRVAREVFQLVTLLAVLASLALLLAGERAATEARDRLLDCTTPEGECYREGQARTGRAVGSINEATVAAAYCARLDASSVAVIRACVERELAR